MLAPSSYTGKSRKLETALTPFSWWVGEHTGGHGDTECHPQCKGDNCGCAQWPGFVFSANAEGKNPISEDDILSFFKC